MTCYMRHMHWLFDALELDYADADNRKRVDQAIRDELAVPTGAHCPEVWSAVKGLDDDAKSALAPAVGRRLG